MTHHIHVPLSLADSSMSSSCSAVARKVRSQSETALDDNTSSNINEGFIKPSRRISFDERVSVREFASHSWAPVQDVLQLSPMGGGRRQKVITVPQVIVCSNPTTDGDDDDDDYAFSCGGSGSNTRDSLSNLSMPAFPQSPRSVSFPAPPNLKARMNPSLGLHQMLRREVRQVLIVDPHDISLSLFSKRLQQAFPHAIIMTAHSSDEAIKQLEHCQEQRTTLDIVIAEERLGLFHRHRRPLGAMSLSSTTCSNNKSSAATCSPKIASGSALLAYMQDHFEPQCQDALLIGVSAHWNMDQPTMVQSGAIDYCWSKAPPPSLDGTMLEELLHTLLLKRGKHELAKAFMVAASSSSANSRSTTSSCSKNSSNATSPLSAKPTTANSSTSSASRKQ